MSRKTLPTERHLQNWIDVRYNVLFEGKHGTGKTSIVKSIFEKNFGEQGVKWKYFSTATLDPWVDFIGVPKQIEDKDGNTYLDLVRPKFFANDEVEAIMLDELNRSNAKVLNAVMELIQFKSINGKPFPNLKVVWAAINPYNEEEDRYRVEKLDDALEDRFHVKWKMPDEPCTSYFQKKFGDAGAAAKRWWMDLGELRDMVSPRRLEYALDAFTKDISITQVLPPETNPGKLENDLKQFPIMLKARNFAKEGNIKEGQEFINEINNFNSLKDYIFNEDTLSSFYIPLIEKENILMVLNSNNRSHTNRIMAAASKERVEGGNYLKDVFEQFVGANAGNKNTIERVKSFLDGKNAPIVECLEKVVEESRKEYTDRRSSTHNRNKVIANLADCLKTNGINNLDEFNQVLSAVDRMAQRSQYSSIKQSKSYNSIGEQIANFIVDYKLIDDGSFKMDHVTFNFKNLLEFWLSKLENKAKK